MRENRIEWKLLQVLNQLYDFGALCCTRELSKSFWLNMKTWTLSPFVFASFASTIGMNSNYGFHLHRLTFASEEFNRFHYCFLARSYSRIELRVCTWSGGEMNSFGYRERTFSSFLYFFNSFSPTNKQEKWRRKKKRRSFNNKTFDSLSNFPLACQTKNGNISTKPCFDTVHPFPHLLRSFHDKIMSDANVYSHQIAPSDFERSR